MELLNNSTYWKSMKYVYAYKGYLAYLSKMLCNVM
jgi:hypothetical protein